MRLAPELLAALKASAASEVILWTESVNAACGAWGPDGEAAMRTAMRTIAERPWRAQCGSVIMEASETEYHALQAAGAVPYTKQVASLLGELKAARAGDVTIFKQIASGVAGQAAAARETANRIAVDPWAARCGGVTMRLFLGDYEALKAAGAVVGPDSWR